MNDMKFVLDTSAYSGFNRGDKRLKEFFCSDNEILVPLIVVGELRAGFSLGTKSKENEELLQKFLDSSNVSTVTITDNTTRLFAAVFQRLKLAGTPINTNDIWIAALTLEHDCLLVTLDSDFNRVPDLQVTKL
ncbi:MAG: type II toxin-antitoxin system VapC family toxin [bacterium]|nr:type II toxin-antitoxin system VapC family toxin [bacterium]